ncbi:MAG: hypothetical protein EP338_07190 [Bacteroidetes bacterium]|nr:MAG: hypothetical protein EP338_07190 [Bacteroidota bacterium]
MKLVHFFFLATFVFSACAQGEGHRIESDYLTVYFDQREDFESARKFARYWKDHGYVASRHQYIRLSRNQSVFQVDLVASDSERAKQMPFSDQKALLEIQRELNDSLGASGAWHIRICDASFQVIANLQGE